MGPFGEASSKVSLRTTCFYLIGSYLRQELPIGDIAVFQRLIPFSVCVMSFILVMTLPYTMTYVDVCKQGRSKGYA